MRKDFSYIYFFVLMVGAGQSIVFAIFPPLARELSMTNIQISIIISTAAFISFISSTFWGKCVDKSGSKFVLLLGITGYSLFNMAFAGILWFAWFFEPFLFGLVLSLLLTRCLFAFFSAAILPSAQTYIISHTSSEERSLKIALLGMMFSIGMILGPAVGGFIVSWGILLPLIVSAVIMLLPLPFIINKIENVSIDQKQASRIENLSFFDKKLRFSILLMITVYVICSAIQQTISFFIQDLLHISAIETARWVSIAFAISAITSVICQGVIIQRWKPSPYLMINMGIIALLSTLFVLFISSGIAMLFIAFALFGVGIGFIYPGIISQASQLHLLQVQGQVTAILQAAMSLGFIIGPLVGAGFYTYIGSWVYSVLLCILLLCGIYTQITSFYRIK